MCIAGGKIIDLNVARRRAPGPCGGGGGGPDRSQKFAPHAHLFFEGDARTSIHIVERGWVKLYRTLIDGQRQVVGFANEGAVLGMEAGGEHFNSCEAITEVVTRSIPVSQLETLIADNPEFGLRLLQQVGAQLEAAQAHLVTIGAQTAEQKLASFLLAIARQAANAGVNEFDLPMRRGEMAEFLGLRLETVSRKMSEFQKRGWIRMTSMYRCRILQPGILNQLAAGSCEDTGGRSASI